MLTACVTTQGSRPRARSPRRCPTPGARVSSQVLGYLRTNDHHQIGKHDAWRPPPGTRPPRTRRGHPRKPQAPMTGDRGQPAELQLPTALVVNVTATARLGGGHSASHRVAVSIGSPQASTPPPTTVRDQWKFPARIGKCNERKYSHRHTPRSSRLTYEIRGHPGPHGRGDP